MVSTEIVSLLAVAILETIDVLQPDHKTSSHSLGVSGLGGMVTSCLPMFARHRYSSIASSPMRMMCLPARNALRSPLAIIRRMFCDEHPHSLASSRVE